MKISLIGGKGLLGGHVAPILNRLGHEVVVGSRSAEVAVDLRTGKGLDRVIPGADVVVHLASDALRPRNVDIDGTARLLEHITDQHLVYISIVGVDHHPLAYYRAKLQAEQMIASAGVEYSIVRATQFHDLVAFIMRKATAGPIALVPRGFVFQPIDVSEVARAVADLAVGPPQGRAADLAGPEVLPVALIARTYMEATSRNRPLARIPIPGGSARAFRSGVNTNPDRAVGKIRWADYLATLRDQHRPGG